jgi:hypothetical protein
MRALHFIPTYAVLAVTVLITGCLGRPDEPEREAVTAFEREVEASLDGIEYRLKRLRATETRLDEAGNTLDDLRRHRQELRRQLDVLLMERDSTSEDIQHRLRDRIEDLAIRYETARLGRFQTRSHFEEAVEARFEDLDRELAVLEGYVFQGDLADRFDAKLAELYRLRNDVALMVAEAEAAGVEEFPRLKSELATVIGRLDIMLAHTTVEVDRAYDKKFPLRSLNKLWL